MSPADAGAVGRTTQRALTLHLGVLVQPYRARGKGQGAPVTTGDVARWLEDKYGIMQAFYRVHGEDVVAKALEDSLAGALESLFAEQRIRSRESAAFGIDRAIGAVDPWGSAMQTIQFEFRKFISLREVERVGIPGVPTRAALRGVNHRFKHPYRKRNPRRPSFRDTGLYMASFRAWVD